MSWCAKCHYGSSSVKFEEFPNGVCPQCRYPAEVIQTDPYAQAKLTHAKNKKEAERNPKRDNSKDIEEDIQAEAFNKNNFAKVK